MEVVNLDVAILQAFTEMDCDSGILFIDVIKLM